MWKRTAPSQELVQRWRDEGKTREQIRAALYAKGFAKSRTSQLLNLREQPVKTSSLPKPPHAPRSPQSGSSRPTTAAVWQLRAQHVNSDDIRSNLVSQGFSERKARQAAQTVSREEIDHLAGASVLFALRDLLWLERPILAQLSCRYLHYIFVLV
jgi:hypothetical protein